MNTQTSGKSVSTPAGEHLSGAPLTVHDTNIVSPTILRQEIDERITKIRPTSTPIDQISRLAGSRKAGSMKVEYYSVDTKPDSSTVSSSQGAKNMEHGDTFTVEVDNPGIFSVSETVLFPSAKCGVQPNPDNPLVGYITNINGSLLTINPTQLPDNDSGFQIPAFNNGDKIVRMGRAACELDVQTAQYAAVPKKNYNYCQIFKAQIEESLYQRLSDKEVGWSFSDQEEVAIIDMRLGMEKSFLFGTRTRLNLSRNGDEVFLTGGIWNQAGQEFPYTVGSFDGNTLVSLMRKAFTKGAGSPKKVLIAGSGLIESLSKLEYNRVVSSGDNETIWGVNFSKIVSKFGTIYVAHSEIFDLCGMPDNGLVIDPEYLTKYSHLPFSADRISFRKQGVRNTEAVVLTEASCLILRYPEAHVRIVANK